MKKGQIYTGIVERMEFPNRGIIYIEGEKAIVKNGLPGQEITFVVNKKRNGRCEGRVLKVERESPLETAKNRCPHFGVCGGCLMQSIPYSDQLRIKEEQVKALVGQVEEIKPSPVWEGYRNKMEFSFGDEVKGGPLALGMHRRGSFHDVVNADFCRITHMDFTRILASTRDYFSERQVPFYKKLRHEGYLRHLLVRRAMKTGEILAYTGSTSSAMYFPGQVELDDGSHAIDYIVMAAPVFQGGRRYAVQQGAGMVVCKSDEKHEYASVEFLKWFTETENNLRFGCISGYLPVRKEANSVEKLDQVIEKQDLDVAAKTYECLTTVFREMEDMTLYTNRSFENGSAARKILEYHLADRAAEDRAGVAAAMEQGQSLEEASAPYVTEEAFEAWYGAFCDALESAVGE